MKNEKWKKDGQETITCTSTTMHMFHVVKQIIDIYVWMYRLLMSKSKCVNNWYMWMNIVTTDIHVKCVYSWCVYVNVLTIFICVWMCCLLISVC